MVGNRDRKDSTPHVCWENWDDLSGNMGISSQKGELKFADGGQQEFVSPGFTTGPMGFANKIRVYSPEMGYEPERMHQHV